MSAREPDLLPLELEDVTFAPDGQVLVDGVSARVAGHGITVLLGPNGAGKTLLLRMCRGLLTPTRGRVRWHGRSPDAVGVRVGFVPQHPAMLRRSVRANLRYAIRHAAGAVGDREARIHEGLELAGLAGRGDAIARNLSGGERQRLAIARAWVQRPRVLLLDEPTAHLDPAAALAIERTIAAIREAGTKVILSTHDLNQARRLAEEVLFLHHGRLLEQTPAETFFSEPATAAASTFISGELLAA
ncbi:MAG: ATP-binding cassette domain-containing protein [Halofilum sp. (in: g-proteobacteria)]|nr:ATP-binding cassette domain-containing protein [Halofilum sp. (in: g-proteobacteria)]